MAYGTIKVDTITFTDAGVDKSVTISGLVQNPTFSGNITVTGTVSGNTIQGQTVSGVTVTGTTSNFASGVFTTQISGATVTGNVGSFTTITGGTVTLTSGVFGAGSASNPSISFTGDPNTGIYSPGADQVAISTNGTRRLIILSDGKVGLGAASVLQQGSGVDGGSGAGILELYNGGTGNTTLENTGAFPILFKTSGTERLRITSAGLVGIGTSSPAFAVDISAANDTIVRSRTNGNTSAGFIGSTNNGTNNWFFGSRKDATGGSSGTDRFNLLYDTNTYLTVTTAGLIGVGTSSPGSPLTIESSAGNQVKITYPSIASYFLNATSGGDFAINKDGSERARIDSSGRLLVGTSTGPSDSTLVLQGNSSNSTYNSVLRMLRNVTNPAADAVLGSIIFGVGDAASSGIECYTDGQWGTNDYPGRLVFSTTADGASSPTERMRIDSAGSLIYGTSTSPGADITSGTGFYYQISTGFFYVRSNGSPVAAFNRGGNDGTLVEFKQDQTTEGTISVSGTTVSYNGAHLSRWSQLPSGAERTEILRGSVLSNIDEMCEWGNEDNEQLNRMKVSDVEGDKNVSGVFQAWDDDDDTYTNDFYCAMTGDFIIRIGAGATVERGDLLMSAGDGTAKSQGDDLVRSCTVAKVTSTNVSRTYADGSYCVPCVLMAC